MTLIQRCYMREFLKLFAVLAVGLSFTFSLFGLIQKLDDFMPHDPSLASLVQYALLRMPQYGLSLMPVACLLCSLYTVGNAGRSNEIVAFMAAGGRLKRLLTPFILTGVLLSLAAFAMSEFVVPPAARAAQEIKNEMSGLGQRKPTLFKNGVLWFRAEDGSIVRIKHYLPSEDAYRDVSIFKVGDGVLVEIQNAEEALYVPEAGAWKLKNVTKFNAADGTSTTQSESFYPHLGSPKVLKESSQKPAEMGIAELYRYSSRLREAGYRNLRLAVDLHSKLSYPVINLIMVLIGISFPLRRSMGGLAATAAGLLITLLYWFGYTMSLSFGYSGILPPVVAAWLMPLAAGAAGTYLFLKIPE